MPPPLVPRGKGAGDTSNYDAYEEEKAEAADTAKAAAPTDDELWKEFDEY